MMTSPRYYYRALIILGALIAPISSLLLSPSSSTRGGAIAHGVRLCSVAPSATTNTDTIIPLEEGRRNHYDAVVVGGGPGMRM